MSKRQTKQGQQYKKNRKETAQAPKKQEGLSTASKVVITVFAVLMALSMMIPSLAGIFGKTEEPTPQTIASIEELDERYTAIVKPLEEKVAADASDMQSMLSLAQYYMNWGYGVSTMATVDAETSHANELLTKAIALYDTYIAANPDEADQPKVDRALCLLFSGETTRARTELITITEENPANATAWANLGLVNEMLGDTDAAREAYNQAIANDPDDAMGAKSYASQRILALNNSQSESLPGALRDLSGTGV